MFLRFTVAVVASIFLVGCNSNGTSTTSEDSNASGPPAPGVSVSEAELADGGDLLTQVNSLEQEGKLEEAIKLVESALEADPDDADVLYKLANLAQSRAGQLATDDRKAASPLFFKSADAMRRLRDIKTELNDSEQGFLGMVLYNEACTHAFNGDAAKALASLREATEVEPRVVGLVVSDSDFEKLRATPEFEAYVAESLKKEAKRLLAAHEPFDFSFSLPDIAGTTVSLDDYQGKILIVDFWGTWCPPCRKEIPHFLELLAKYQDLGLEIVGVNYERVPAEEWPETIKSFTDANGVTYPCLIGDDATRQQVPNFRAFPTTLFIDAKGKVRLMIVGYNSYGLLEAIVSELLAEADKA